MNTLNLQMEALEEVTAPARDFIEGVAVGVTIVAGIAGAVAFT